MDRGLGTDGGFLWLARILATFASQLAAAPTLESRTTIVSTCQSRGWGYRKSGAVLPSSCRISHDE